RTTDTRQGHTVQGLFLPFCAGPHIHPPVLGPHIHPPVLGPHIHPPSWALTSTPPSWALTSTPPSWALTSTPRPGPSHPPPVLGPHIHPPVLGPHIHPPVLAPNTSCTSWRHALVHIPVSGAIADSVDSKRMSVVLATWSVHSGQGPSERGSSAGGPPSQH
ncbi:hypothetical protein KUCAC02_030346, partial [Chaenocephalus aceratus]